jgi:hypothetical protein
MRLNLAKFVCFKARRKNYCSKYVTSESQNNNSEFLILIDYPEKINVFALASRSSSMSVAQKMVVAAHLTAGLWHPINAVQRSPKWQTSIR